MLQAVSPETRDRSHSHMGPDVRKLDALAERSIARMMGGLRGLGFPRRTLLARMIEFGIRGAAQQGSGDVEDLPQDQQMFWRAFNIVCHTEIKKSFFLAVYTENLPPTAHARRFGWSKDRTNRELRELRRSMIVSLRTMGMRFDV